MAKNPYTEKKKASNKRYMDSLTRISVWVTPEEKEKVAKDAEDDNKSMNGYIRNKLGLKDTPKPKHGIEKEVIDNERSQQ